jgi:hypothetical protein
MLVAIPSTSYTDALSFDADCAQRRLREEAKHQVELERLRIVELERKAQVHSTALAAAEVRQLSVFDLHLRACCRRCSATLLRGVSCVHCVKVVRTGVHRLLMRAAVDLSNSLRPTLLDRFLPPL